MNKGSNITSDGDIPSEVYHRTASEFNDSLPKNTVLRELDIPSDAVRETAFLAPITKIGYLLRTRYGITGIENEGSNTGLNDRVIEYVLTQDRKEAVNNVIDVTGFDTSTTPSLREKRLIKKQLEHNKKIEKIIEQRSRLKDIVIENIKTEITELQDMKDVSFEPVRVYPSSNGKQTDGKIRTIGLDDINTFDFGRHGFTLPFETVMCTVSDNGTDGEKRFPFIPWYGVMSCSCMTRRRTLYETTVDGTGEIQYLPVNMLEEGSYSRTPVCKHELAALDKYANDAFLFGNDAVTQRCKRLVHQTDHNVVTNEILSTIDESNE